MKKIITIFSLLFVMSFTASAQQYYSAVGVRGGLFNSISYKKTLNDFSAIEGIGSLYRRGLLVTGLYTIQNPLNIEGEYLEWYYGGGAHVGFFNNRYADFLGETSSSAVLGIDGVIGVEYTFSEFPLNVSLDYKPAFNIIGYTGFWFDHLSLGIRYVIN